MPVPVPTRLAEQLADLLAPRCPTCRGVVPSQGVVVNFGDLQFHPACGPGCANCARRLRPGEGGWRIEGTVVSEPWGYGVQPTRVLCPECLGAAPRDEPRGGS